MCAPNKTKKGNKAFSYLFSHTLSDHHNYLPWCQAAWAPCQEWKFFLIKHELYINVIIIEVFYHLNKMLIATEHIADNNFVFQ